MSASTISKNYLNPAFGVKEYLVSERAAGRIKHLGFPTTAASSASKRFLAAYEDVIEFCQIQLNWLDWDFQEAKEKVRILNEKKIPIIVMEPLRGGTLVEPAGRRGSIFSFPAVDSGCCYDPLRDVKFGADAGEYPHF